MAIRFVVVESVLWYRYQTEEFHRGHMNVCCHRKDWSTLWSFPIDPAAIFSMWPRNAPTSFQLSKMLGTHTNTGCWSVSRHQASWHANMNSTFQLPFYLFVFFFDECQWELLFVGVSVQSQTTLELLICHFTSFNFKSGIWRQLCLVKNKSWF